MFVIEPYLINQIAAEVGEGDPSWVELHNTISARDSQIEAIAHLFQAELDGGGLGESLYTESLMQVLIVHLLRQYSTLRPQIHPIAERLSSQWLQPVWITSTAT